MLASYGNFFIRLKALVYVSASIPDKVLHIDSIMKKSIRITNASTKSNWIIKVIDSFIRGSVD
jgi:hypothetical protein